MKIEHIAMYVNDLEEARDFFVTYFGGKANDGYHNPKTNFRSYFITLPDSIDEYDTIVLAYPNYWGTMPMAVFTFLEAFDFSRKTILPLCTKEGIGMGGSERDIKKACPGADVKKGLSITGSQAAESRANVEMWLSANGLL